MSGSNGFDLEEHKILYFTDALGVYLLSRLPNIDSLTLLFVL